MLDVGHLGHLGLEGLGLLEEVAVRHCHRLAWRSMGPNRCSECGCLVSEAIQQGCENQSQTSFSHIFTAVAVKKVDCGVMRHNFECNLASPYAKICQGTW